MAVLAVLALILVGVGSVWAGPFDRSPRQYGTPVNHILQQVGSDFRLQLEECDTFPSLQCRFVALRVAVLVRGRDSPPRIETIAISTDLLRDNATANPLAAMTDVVLVFGATVVIFDPDLSPDRRVPLLSDTVERALTTGTSQEDGLEAHYALRFDEAADGLLVIAIAPRA